MFKPTWQCDIIVGDGDDMSYVTTYELPRQKNVTLALAPNCHPRLVLSGRTSSWLTVDDRPLNSFHVNAPKKAWYMSAEAQQSMESVKETGVGMKPDAPRAIPCLTRVA